MRFIGKLCAVSCLVHAGVWYVTNAHGPEEALGVLPVASERFYPSQKAGGSQKGEEQ